VGDGAVTVRSAFPGALRNALAGTGWVDGEVRAVGQLRQGRAPSLAGMQTGAAVVGILRPRGSKSLPRHFVLAVVDDRVVAFKASGGSPEDGPRDSYEVRMVRGEQGSWPLATVRLSGLREGARSKEATLHLGDEEIPVCRPNLGGDPDTDELLGLLGGAEAAAATRPRNAQDREELEDHDDLRRASALAAGDGTTLVEEARTGVPTETLAGWAGRRGLEYRLPIGAQSGHLLITCPWSKGLLQGVVRGRGPDGRYAVAAHEVRILGAGARGVLRGRDVLGQSLLRDVVNDVLLPISLDSRGDWVRVPYTVVGGRVAHLAALRGLHVARRGERYTRGNQLWTTIPVEGVDGHWVAAVRHGSDERAVRALLDGVVREILGTPRGLGFELRVEYGQALAAQQDFLRRDEDLDALAGAAARLVAAVGPVCAPVPLAVPLDTALAEPDWLPAVRRKPREKVTVWPLGARTDPAVRYAGRHGLALEDPAAFFAAFPGANVPGQAFAVMRGRLPGTGLTGRLLVSGERPFDIPDDIRRLLHDPGGRVGADVVMVAAAPTAPATAPEGELDGDVRFAVGDGVLTAWRPRPRWQLDEDHLDALCRDVAAFATRRGLVG
jgi:hypothetical protein